MHELDSLVVEPSDWVATFSTHKDEGFDYLDFLSVREIESGDFVVSAHLINVAGERRVLIEATWSAADANEIPSLREVFAGARWHELEASELFGIGFVASDGTAISSIGDEPFISTESALRRDFALAPRLDQDWPGTNEPGLDPDHPRRKRKRAVPGNPPTWEASA